MAIPRTMAELRDGTLQRADMANSSQFIDTTPGVLGELDVYIRQSLMSLIDLVIDCGGENYVSQFDTTAGTTAGGRIALSNNAYRVMSVWRPDGAKRWRVLPMSRSDVDRLYRTQYGPEVVQYRIVGGLNNAALTTGNTAVEFLPEPPLGTQFIIRQVQTPALPVLTTDTWDFPNGWEEYVMLDAAIKCVMKEEGDVSALGTLRAEVKQRIIEACQNEDTRWPSLVEDVMSPYGWDGRRWNGGWEF